ncbi:uncharacterized protein LOC122946963 isoform X3 [Acropora millepora]|uniref:uncharacterized protein LOC122946963 isoform X3 n=1 Tax=Acropora millepora TaxID=45264 RepID=UPI001CF53334|nr:uncharacterized protein LOC122946963 isoform X3 [Acropora millepora]
MEAKFIIVTLIYGLVTTALAGQDLTDYHDAQCPLELKETLPGINCTSHDCREMTCSGRIRSQETYLSLTIKQWGGTINAYVTLSVPKLQFHWSGLFRDGDRKKIAGFPLKIWEFVNADAFFLHFSVKKTNGTIDFKVELQAVFTGVKERAFVNTTVMEAKVPDMPEPTPEIVVCYIGWPGESTVAPVLRKLQRLPRVAKVMIAIGAFVFVVLVAGAVTMSLKKKASHTKQLNIKPPSYDEAMSTKTKVPMQPLVEEV